MATCATTVTEASDQAWVEVMRRVGAGTFLDGQRERMIRDQGAWKYFGLHGGRA